ncbi:hypothetical protein HT031_002356 [Scenedesmus sp. PABB004]|nr:hypothetical protein HT031_002356 [Scenedesmus sp. PABB004]
MASQPRGGRPAPGRTGEAGDAPAVPSSAVAALAQPELLSQVLYELQLTPRLRDAALVSRAWRAAAAAGTDCIVTDLYREDASPVGQPQDQAQPRGSCPPAELLAAWLARPPAGSGLKWLHLYSRHPAGAPATHLRLPWPHLTKLAALCLIRLHLTDSGPPPPTSPTASAAAEAEGNGVGAGADAAAGLAGLSALSGLQDLRLMDCTVEPAGVSDLAAALAHLTSLHSLHLDLGVAEGSAHGSGSKAARAPPAGEAAAPAAALVAALAGLTRLRRLRLLPRWPGWSSDHASAAVGSLTALESLSLRFCRLQPSHLAALSGELTSLELGEQPGPSSAALVLSPAATPRLAQLRWLLRLRLHSVTINPNVLTSLTQLCNLALHHVKVALPPGAGQAPPGAGQALPPGEGPPAGPPALSNGDRRRDAATVALLAAVGEMQELAELDLMGSLPHRLRDPELARHYTALTASSDLVILNLWDCSLSSGTGAAMFGGGRSLPELRSLLLGVSLATLDGKLPRNDDSSDGSDSDDTDYHDDWSDDEDELVSGCYHTTSDPCRCCSGVSAPPDPWDYRSGEPWPAPLGRGDLAALAATCPKLNALQLTGALTSKAQWRELSSLTALTRLTYLVVGDYGAHEPDMFGDGSSDDEGQCSDGYPRPIRDRTAEHIALLTRLRSLVLFHAEPLGGAQLLCLTTLVKLRRLFVQGCGVNRDLHQHLAGIYDAERQGGYERHRPPCALMQVWKAQRAKQGGKRSLRDEGLFVYRVAKADESSVWPRPLGELHELFIESVEASEGDMRSHKLDGYIEGALPYASGWLSNWARGLPAALRAQLAGAEARAAEAEGRAAALSAAEARAAAAEAALGAAEARAAAAETRAAAAEAALAARSAAPAGP